jgi:hypothetical protein
MKLSSLLDKVSIDVGADSLCGAAILLRLKRPIDDLISKSLALGPYHPGKPSPWSHTVILAEPYRGLETKILDCTIRDGNGNVDWSSDLLPILRKGIDKNGGIYDGAVEDYDDRRVTATSVKYVPALSVKTRKDIVEAGKSLQSQGYKYDIPGLVRELIRLVVHLPVPAGKKLLFCSGFVQECYRKARAGNFNPALNPKDVTPDDIWYSSLGIQLP